MNPAMMASTYTVALQGGCPGHCTKKKPRYRSHRYGVQPAQGALGSSLRCAHRSARMKRDEEATVSIGLAYHHLVYLEAECPRLRAGGEGDGAQAAQFRARELAEGQVDLLPLVTGGERLHQRYRLVAGEQHQRVGAAIAAGP